MIDLSIVILNYNTGELLQNCLTSILNHTRKIKYEILVVDNASTDDSLQKLENFKNSKFEGLKIIKNTENLGFAAGNNAALKKAKGEYCLLLNSDTVLKENALKKMLAFARSKPKLGALGPRLLNQDGSFQPSTAPFFTLNKVFLWLFSGDRFLYRSPQRAQEVDWVMGSALMIPRKILSRVGFLDEKFFMYVEEQEWCYRIKKAGWQVWFCPEATIYHLVRGSSPEGKQKVIWWIYEGLLYFYRKHFGIWAGFMLKFFLRMKAGLAWGGGVLTNNDDLKKTYAKAFKMV